MERYPEKTYCKLCDRRTNHDILHCHHVKGQETDDEGVPFLWWDEKSYIVQCAGCDEVGFIKVYGDSEMYSYGNDGEMYYDTSVKVFPAEPEREPPRGRELETKHFSKVPELLLSLYSQIVNAFNDKAYILVGIGLRTMVEAICKDLEIEDGYVLDEDGNKKVDKQGNEIRSRKLAGKINGLVEKSVILPKQAEIIDQLRDLGNEVVHEIKVPKRSTLSKGIAIIEFLLEHTYDLDKYLLRSKN